MTRAWLGVTIQKVTPDLAQVARVEDAHGALVAEVTPDSPAATSGIEPGDVITRYDGKKVDEHAALPMLVASTPVGKTVPVEVVRDGKTKTLRGDGHAASRRRGGERRRRRTRASGASRCAS